MSGERGTITLWLLGLAVSMLFLGGLSLDLWRAFEVRRSLAVVVDAAGVAGASALDTERFRAAGQVALDPQAARAAAWARLGAAAGRFEVDASPEAVVVTGQRDVPLTLTRALLPGDPLTVRVEATVRPIRSP